jgi:hypothetical protein
VAVVAGPKSQAIAFRRRLEAVVSRRTSGSAHITTAAVAFGTGASFQACMSTAIRAIRAEKESRQSDGVANSAMLTGPYYHRCDLIPTLPAVRIRPVGNEDRPRYLSAAASSRIEAAGKSRIRLDRHII